MNPEAAPEGRTQADIEAIVDAELGLPTKVAEPAGEPEPPIPPAEPAAPEPDQADEPPIPPAEPEPEPEPAPEPEPEPQAPSNPELFIEVEDASGQKLKITTIDDLPADFQPKNNKQIFEILRGVDKLENDRAAAEQRAAVDAETQAAETDRRETLQLWDSELGELQKEGRLAKPKLAQDHPDFANDPGVKKADQAFKFMAEENQRRTEAAKPLLRSFRDAFDLYEYREYQKTQAEAAKAETANAKAKSGIIGRTSSAGDEAYVYRAGQARSIDDLDI